LFRGWKASGANVEKARDMIASWDALLTKDSVPAAIYVTRRRSNGAVGCNRRSGLAIQMLRVPLLDDG
jgi:hypothetical protein